MAYQDSNYQACLSLRQADILVALAKDEELCKQGGCVPALQSIPRCVTCQGHAGPNVTDAETSRSGEQLPTFHPEFGCFMLEATPGKPWGIDFKDLLDVERNMKWRYASSQVPALL